MHATTYTTDEFARAFPRARGHHAALSYVAIAHHPKAWSDAETEARAFGNAVRVGGTNISNSKAVTRFAILPEAA